MTAMLAETPLDRDRWNRLLAALGIGGEAECFDALLAAYSEKHRHYHTTRHIDHCLRELDSAKSLARDPAEVELALWFHDAIYDPHSSKNEERSADWACELLTRHHASAERIGRVRDHILATRHEAVANDPDSRLVVDIDLSILGVDEAAYAEFEVNVRQEYRWVPSLLFRRKRAEILESFLARPQIYTTQLFKDRYESQARRNLVHAIQRLRE
jgi:predicted metal-dependent HD superfamily phosphohydrolase